MWCAASGVCALTDGVFGGQVDGVCVQVLQEGAVHQVGELVNLDGRLIGVVQQGTEMLAPGRGARAGEFRPTTPEGTAPD